MNRSKKLATSWMTRGVLLAVLVVLALSQASLAFAGTGAVTMWGQLNLSPQPAVPLPAGVTSSFVSAGFDGAYTITNDGVYFWGGVTIAPIKINFPASVTQVSTISDRNDLTLAITNDGLYGWGSNGRGQLGDGTYIGRFNAPAKVLLPATVTAVSAIAAGYYHGLAVTNDGLYAWGDNTNGELGNGTRTSTPLPVKVALPASVTSVTAVAAGDNSSYAVTNDGLYAWGNNYAGQLGIGTSVTDVVLPVKVSFNTSTKGKKTPVPTVTSVTAVAAGLDYALAITNDGLYAWGQNFYGQLGIGSQTDKASPTKVLFPTNTVITVTAISAGRDHNVSVTSDGLYAWGSNAGGKLGMGTLGGPANGLWLTPTKVPGEDAAIMAAAGENFSIALH